MWGLSTPASVPPPLYGPHRVLDELDLKEAFVGLLLAARELCLRDIKNKDISESVVRGSHHEDELEQIAERFILKGREAVCDFLRQHQALVPILIQVRTKFDEYFGITEFARPRLEVFVDPEGENSEPSLFALVPTTLPFQEAVIRLDRLDEDWWLDQPSEVRCLMNIDVEYVNAPTL